MTYILTLNDRFIGDYQSRDEAERWAQKIAAHLDSTWKYAFNIYERPGHWELDHARAMDS